MTEAAVNGSAAPAERAVFDAHLHIIDPRFPLVPNSGYLPDAFTVADYRERTRSLDVAGGAVVSGSFQADDQEYLRAALKDLGPGWVGVTQLPATASDADILALHAAGVRAVRCNIARGGPEAAAGLDALARRVHEVAGWHVELYVDSRALADLMPVLSALPRISIDHLGMHEGGLHDLLRLVERGAYVKATGFGRVELDPARVMADVLRANPGSLIVGTDLPSTRAARPFRDSDLDLIAETAAGIAGQPGVDAVFWDNAARLYRLDG